MGEYRYTYNGSYENDYNIYAESLDVTKKDQRVYEHSNISLVSKMKEYKMDRKRLKEKRIREKKLKEDQPKESFWWNNPN